MTLRPCWPVPLSLILACLPAAAQTNIGRITGTVSDPSGAPVPECLVTAANAQTGLKQAVRTEHAGYYVFASLPAGLYILTAEKSGFRASVQSGIVLDASSQRSIDFRLEVGAVSDSVSVAASVEQVQTSSGDVGRVITDKQLSQIALNGRNYVQLLRLIPGAVATNLDPFSLALQVNGQAINGIRSASTYFTVDGAENLDTGASTNSIVNPNVDTIAEVRILTSGYSAEFGGRSGAMVNVVTKSGTRAFHGTLFEFVRNDRLFDARSFFAATVDPLHFNNFGWTLGGPALMPGKWNAGRDKLFFFASQEWKYNHAGSTRLNFVPTQEERAGDFRNSRLAAPVDPTTNAPFPNRVIPASRFSRNGPLLLTPYPLPNSTAAGGNYAATGVARTDTREDLIRADYNWSSNTQLMYRWTHDSWDIFDPFQGGALGITPGARPRPGYVTTLSLTHVFSPTTLNSSSFSVSSNKIRGSPEFNNILRSTLGLTYPEIYPVNRSAVAPRVNISGFAGYTEGDRGRNSNTTFQFRDDFSKVVDTHTLKFGVELARSRKSGFSNAVDQGIVTFNTSAKNTTRNVLADVLLGNFQTYTEDQANVPYWSRFTQAEFYAQDSWKVNRRLTVEIGLRYNLIPPLYNALGDESSFLPSLYNRANAPLVNASDGSIVPGTGDPYNGIVLFGNAFPDAAKGRVPLVGDPSIQRLFIGLPRSGMKTVYTDFGPRFGFAWDPFGTGKTAVRGGFGIFFDQLNQGIGGTANPPISVAASVFDGNIDNPASGTRKEFPPALSNVVPKFMTTPKVMTYNLGVQREWKGGIILDVGYVGNLARHLLQTTDLNQLPEGARLNPPASTTNVNALRPYLGYASIQLRGFADTSNYNSLQVSASRRTRQGLSFGLSYTFSKTLDSSSGTPQNAYNARADYGLSSIHRAHLLNVNYIYELPFFRKNPNALVRAVGGGWDISGLVSFQSGAPNSVVVPVDVAGIGAASTRATVIANPALPGGERTLARWFNTEAFLPPNLMTPGRFGTSGRNILIGPAFSQFDLAIARNFAIRERARLQFRAESFNVLNHASFTGINTTVRFDSAGKPSQGYGAINAAGIGRVLEFGMKLIF